jgi:ribA/ribD-fused uncharacterized protein
MPILFYGHKSGPYKSFSNWYACKFKWNGFVWSNSEQAYMSAKSFDKEYQLKIKKTTNPAEAKKIGRKVKLRPDWDKVKYQIMIDILLAKFSQNPMLSEILLETGSENIHEDCNDPWWGGGPNFPGGRDLLGKALISVRKTLKKNI